MTNQLFALMQHPEEWKSLYDIRKKYKAYKPDQRTLNDLSDKLSDIEFCYAALSKVSRSFSVVIRMLPEELRDVICLFYLVLRALDSIEDDTNTEMEVRVKILSQFHLHLHDPEWNISGVGTNEDYSMLLENFQKVSACFRQLDSKYQRVIQRICKEMGHGMIQYLDRELEKTSEYDEYCYYVAGLVGVGLTELFVLSGLEDLRLADQKDLQIAMGLFLQKTNIIRDIREDLDENRTFWPKQIWEGYADNLDDFKESKSAEARFCLNHMITNALALAPQCLQYLRLIRNPGIFKFCAIPQVMAIATLAEVFDNSDVFNRNVKIRKGLGATLFLKTSRYNEALSIFHSMADNIFEKICLDDPNLLMHVRNLQKIQTVSESFTIFRNRKKSNVEINDITDFDTQPLYNIKAQ